MSARRRRAAVRASAPTDEPRRPASAGGAASCRGRQRPDAQARLARGGRDDAAPAQRRPARATSSARRRRAPLRRPRLPRWLLPCSSCSAPSASSTGSRSRRYVETREQLAERRCRGRDPARRDAPARPRASSGRRASRRSRATRAGSGTSAPASSSSSSRASAAWRREALGLTAPRTIVLRPRRGRSRRRRAQLGREPRAFRRVAARCPWGRPAVTEQDPYGADGAPFPTTYYLTCRHLVAAVSRLEAAGGVERWTAAVASDPALARRSRAGDRGAGRDPARARRGRHRRRLGRVARVRDRRLAQPRRAQVPPRARRVRARPAGLPARRGASSPRSPSRGPRTCCSPRLRRRASIAPMPAVASARRDWEDGIPPLRRRDAGPGPRRRLHRQVDVVTAELRRRRRRPLHAGRAGRRRTPAPSAWVLQAVEERAPSRGWARTAIARRRRRVPRLQPRRARLRAVSDARRAPRAAPRRRAHGAGRRIALAVVPPSSSSRSASRSAWLSRTGPSRAAPQTSVRTLEPLPQQPTP